METEKNSVIDGKIDLTDEQIGKLQRKLNEAIRRIKQGTIDYDETVEALQKIIIEGQAPLHLKVIKGSHGIKAIEHLIDCDAAPFIQPGWSVEAHQKRGLLRFNPARVILHLTREQKKSLIGGHELRKELDKLPTMNANVLDYLLAHPELIPEEWKGKLIFFWGTIYRRSDGQLFVRNLSWIGSQFGWSNGCAWLADGFYVNAPAALASDLKI